MQAIAADIRYRLLWCKMLSILFLILVSCEAIGHGVVLFWGCNVWTGCKCKYIHCLIESFFVHQNKKKKKGKKDHNLNATDCNTLARITYSLIKCA